MMSSPWPKVRLRQQDLLQKEFIALVQQAKTLYSKVKKKKGGGSTF